MTDYQSERDRIRTCDRLLRRQMLYPAELRTRIVFEKYDNFLSGRQDSNLRPPGPKPGAMTGLRYAPRFFFEAEGMRFELMRHLRVDSLANCSVNHSGNPPFKQYLCCLLFRYCECKYRRVFHISQIFFLIFFRIFDKI